LLHFTDMKVLVVGGGAREHALCWALRRSGRLSQLYCAPGNAGTAQFATNMPIAAEAVEELADWATESDLGLTVVGPEAPLAAGLVDAFRERGLRAFGPSRQAAEIEASKCWSWGFMERHGVPTPHARECTDITEGLSALSELGLPIAIKADGLAAGKGVVIAHTRAEAQETLDWMLDQHGLGAAGQRVLVQEFLDGPELSVLAFVDGHEVALMPAARDYKRIGDADQGPNTGGMGAYSRPSFATPDLLARVRQEIFEPTVAGMAAEGRPFKGVLYAGLILSRDGPKVLEFNCRFGDPETQVILPLLDSDLLDILELVVDGRLSSIDISWRPAAACGVVLASEGYPDRYPMGRTVNGLDALPPDALVFHAGTTRRNGEVVTAGGRVLTSTGVGDGLPQAREAAYDTAARIQFEGCYYRSDIAADDGRAAGDTS
jgi:phosphoribosylamine---glycine ligase